MKKRNYIIFFIIALFFSLIVFSLNKKRTIKGEVAIVGTSLFPRVLIREDENKEYFFSDSLFEEYKKYTGSVIIISAVIKKQTFSLADGSKSFIEFVIVKSSLINTKGQEY